MTEDSANSDDKPKTPPPSLPQSQPGSPPPPPKEESGPPPVNVGPTQGSPESSAQPSPTGQQAVPGADASMANRVIAAIIDGLVASVLQFGLAIILPWFLDWVAWFVWIGYMLVRDSLPFLDGQSVGKKAMGIQAVTMDGKSLAGNWQPGIVRNILMAIPFGALVELIVMLTRMDKPKPLLRLGDEWAKTKVINTPKTAPAGQVEQAPATPPPAAEGEKKEEGGGS